MDNENANDRHEFAQRENVSVHVCKHCGKWPMHHNHHDEGAALCACAGCRTEGTVIL